MPRKPKITIFEQPSASALESAKLKWWRQHVKGWTRTYLAQQLGYTESALGRYEGERRGAAVAPKARGWARLKMRCAQLDGVAPDKFTWGIK